MYKPFVAPLLALCLAVGVTSACKHTGEEPVAAEDVPVPPGIETLPLEVVVATRLNVRAGPGPEHPVVGKLAQGEQVRVLEEMNGWKRVRPDAGGLEGWVAGEFVTPATAP